MFFLHNLMTQGVFFESPQQNIYHAKVTFWNINRRAMQFPPPHLMLNYGFNDKLAYGLVEFFQVSGMSMDVQPCQRWNQDSNIEHVQQ